MFDIIEIPLIGGSKSGLLKQVRRGNKFEKHYVQSQVYEDLPTRSIG